MTEAMPFLQKIDITFLRPPTIRPGRFYISYMSNGIFFNLLAESVRVGGHGDGELNLFAVRKGGNPVEEFDDLVLGVGVEKLMEVVDKYVGDIIVPGAQAGYEALHELKGANLIVAGVYQAGLIGYVEREVPVLLYADDVAVLLPHRRAHELDELLGFTGSLQACDNFDHMNHAPYSKLRQRRCYCIYSLPFFPPECNK